MRIKKSSIAKRLKILEFFSASVLFSSFLFSGTTGKIAGLINEGGSQAPLVGVNIIITSEWVNDELVDLSIPLGAATSLTGEYFILNLQPGFYDIQAQMIGYRSEKRSKVRVDVDKTTWVNFTLDIETLAGEEVLVTAQREDRIEIDQTVTKQVYMIDEIREIAGIADIDDIMDLQADVVDNNIRGGREGESLYLINGATIVNPLSNQRAYTPMIAGMQQVEVITSGFSAEYGNVQSGVINMVPKEGSSKWIIHGDFSGSLPHARNWGGNYYDLEGNSPFDIFYSGPEAWMSSDPNDPSRAFFTSSTPNWTSYMPEEMTLEDSLKFAELAYKQFLGFARELGIDNESKTDYRASLSLGGPLSTRSRIFIAGSQQIEHEKLPTVWPKRKRQVMANLTNDIGSLDKLYLSLNYYDGFDNTIMPGIGVPYLFELEHKNIYHETNVLESGLRYIHIFSQAALLELNARYLYTDEQDHIATREPGVYLIKNANSYITKYSAPGGLTNNIFARKRGGSTTKTFSLSGFFTHQINNSILSKLGWQYYLYDLNVNREQDIDSPGSVSLFKFNGNPFEGALYAQNKLEFQGMIANLGLRYDIYDFNNDYFSDIFSPLRNPEFNPDPSIPYNEREPYYDMDKALQTKSKTFTRIQPRIGLAYPVSEKTVVHVNYGTFTQRPDFTKIYDNYITTSLGDATESFTVSRLGNPRLRPENTTAYDLGFVQYITRLSSVLEVSAYYKDVKDLVQHVYYEDEKGNLYETFANREYADIKGFHTNFEKRHGDFTAIMRYNFQVGTGKSATPFDADIKFIEKPDEGELPVELPDPEDEYLNFDRTHRFVSYFSYRTGRDSGPIIFKDFRPLSDWALSLRYSFQSGRPYTYDDGGLGAKFNKRTPVFHNVKLRMQKMIRLKQTSLSVYVEVYNLLNQRDYAYTLFNNANAVSRWETYYDDDQTNDIGDPMLFDDWDPLLYRQELIFLKNTPRYFKIGLIIN